MVFPLGMGMVSTGPPPEEVKNQKPFWTLLMVLFAVTCAGRVVGTDIFGALLSGIMGGVVWYMVKDGFETMPRMIMMFGILCCFNAIFEMLPLVSALQGRSEQKVEELSKGEDPSKKTFSVTVETHPFFDPDMGLSYNALSATMLLSPVSMLVGAFLSYHAYQAFAALQPDDPEDRNPLMGGGGMGGMMGGNAGAYGNQGATARTVGRPLPAAQQQTFQMFGGEGKKLGG